MRNVWRRVVLAAALAAAAAPASAQFGQNKIAYDRFDWSIYRSTHFQIYFYPKERGSLEKVASFAESAYDELSRSLNYQIPHPIPLIYYSSHSEFEQTNTELDFIDEGTGAFALPSRDRMVLPIDVPDAYLQSVIQHELTHVFEFEILFQGNFLRAVTSPIPQWFMEGLASYYGHDETNRSRMYLRDAVITDNVPAIARGQDINPYFAYRFGHAVFDFIEHEWGKDAVRDFVYEFRTSLGGGVQRVVKRAFDISAEDFDIRFRRYLRQRYIPELTTKGEPVDYGQPFRIKENQNTFSWDVSPVPFPSGDFLAAVSTYDLTVPQLNASPDVVVYSVKDRKLFRNLSKGYTTRYEYLIAQAVTISLDVPGRTVGVSPDGNHIAAFVRRERGRNLALWNVLSGKLEREIPFPTVDQEVAPSYSPDGKKVVFSGISNGNFEIWSYDLASGTLTNVTNDPAYDAAPTYSPDGKWIYYSSISGTYSKIFRVDPANPSVKEQVTFGDWNDDDPFVSPDGTRLFFTSDRDGGIYNIFSVDLSTGETWQHTNVIGGAFQPSVFTGKDGIPRLTFCSFYRQRYGLYVADVQKTYARLAALNPPPVRVDVHATARYTPAIEVSLDPEKIQAKPSHKLYIDNANVAAGVNSDGTLFSDTSVLFSDNLGDRRALISLQSISSYTDVHLVYYNLKHRLQLGGMLYDDREYFIGLGNNAATGFITRDRRFYRETGALGLAAYPLDRYHRIEGSLGYVSRSIDFPFAVNNVNEQNQITQAIIFANRKDDDPTGSVTFTGDTALYTEVGPLAGHRYALSYSYTPDLKSGTDTVGIDLQGNPITIKRGGTLTQSVSLDFRQYLRITKRSTLAFRAFGVRSTGTIPDISYFGGIDTVRAYDFRSEIGTEVAFGNLEYRFPLIDRIVLFGGLPLSNIRGKLFVDVGAARLAYGKTVPWRFWNGSGHTITYSDPINGTVDATYKPYQLINGKADYGWGFTLNLLGLDLHWDFAKQWDFRRTLSGFKTSFYIGTEF
jgi:WD40 repeat protein